VRVADGHNDESGGGSEDGGVGWVGGGPQVECREREQSFLPWRVKFLFALDFRRNSPLYCFPSSSHFPPMVLGRGKQAFCPTNHSLQKYIGITNTLGLICLLVLIRFNSLFEKFICLLLYLSACQQSTKRSYYDVITLLLKNLTFYIVHFSLFFKRSSEYPLLTEEN